MKLKKINLYPQETVYIYQNENNPPTANIVLEYRECGLHVRKVDETHVKP